MKSSGKTEKYGRRSPTETNWLRLSKSGFWHWNFSLFSWWFQAASRCETLLLTQTRAYKNLGSHGSGPMLIKSVWVRPEVHCFSTPLPWSTQNRDYLLENFPGAISIDGWIKLPLLVQHVSHTWGLPFPTQTSKWSKIPSDCFLSSEISLEVTAAARDRGERECVHVQKKCPIAWV